jgi:hypothetical protein
VREPDTQAPAARRSEGQGRLLVDDAADVAPAGPATATADGVVMIDKNDRVLLAARHGLPSAAHPAPSPLDKLERTRDDFAPHGRGPAVLAGFAYWVSQGRLLRSRVSGVGEPEVLARDARNGTRVAAAEGPEGAGIVAYITTIGSGDAPHAKLWTTAGKTYDLTAEGAGTSSVSLVTQQRGWMAITLDGRSGMTPLNARVLLRSGTSEITLGADVVSWVGASAQATTEVFAAATNDDLWAFVPIEQDVTHFGLARIHVGTKPRLDVPASFITYPNGTNSAPVAVASVCGRTTLVFAQPASAEPNAPEELLLTTLENGELEPAELVANGRAFANASLAPLPGGALLVYRVLHRTLARTLRCRRDSEPAPATKPAHSG